ncbi:MAG TPA: hypothetical protein ENO22_03700 [candidate division Zixibacteria bacterium]|nr:hypothetical protein [candidate division Zixibacteria bacterium]HEQ98429.1 hypothetical protein [candidate division Zixibacteria bacterium]
MKAKVRRLVKFLISVMMYYSGILRLYSRVKPRNWFERNLKILLYHRVLAEGDKKKAELQPGMCVLQSSFERQIRFIKRKFEIISVAELVAMLSRNEFPDKRIALVTFDDGWRDNYDYAFPVLQKYGSPATIFLATDYISCNNLPLIIEVNLLLSEADLWPDLAIQIFETTVSESGQSGPDQSPGLPDNPKMRKDPFKFIKAVMGLDSGLQKIILDKMKARAALNKSDSNERWMLNKEEIKQMYASGIDFGSHGKSHQILTALDETELIRELEESKQKIENILNTEVISIAYPNGDYNSSVTRSARECGYKIGMAVSTDGGTADHPDIFAMKRININEGSALGPRGRFSKAVFACLLEGLFQHF